MVAIALENRDATRALDDRIETRRKLSEKLPGSLIHSLGTDTHMVARAISSCNRRSADWFDTPKV
jgi:hypothetical protein